MKTGHRTLRCPILEFGIFSYLLIVFRVSSVSSEALWLIVMPWRALVCCAVIVGSGLSAQRADAAATGLGGASVALPPGMPSGCLLEDANSVARWLAICRFRLCRGSRKLTSVARIVP